MVTPVAVPTALYAYATATSTDASADGQATLVAKTP